MQIAEKEGYVVREMGESEKVMREYKKICIHGSWLDRLLCPVRGLLCNGIIGADGEEREVRLYHADKMRKYHDAAVKYGAWRERRRQGRCWRQPVATPLTTQLPPPPTPRPRPQTRRRRKCSASCRC